MKKYNIQFKLNFKIYEQFDNIKESIHTIYV